LGKNLPFGRLPCSKKNHNTSKPGTLKAASTEKAKRFFEEESPEVLEVAPGALRKWTRRDLLLFGAGSVAAATGFVSLLPQQTLERLGVRGAMNSPSKKWLLNRALRFDDVVPEALWL
jgi:hypothetical protein